MNNADYWIKHLNLKPHPEGGFFSEVYRAAESIEKNALPERFQGKRVFSTSIYFLLQGKQFSAFHKIKQDEIWHHYAGCSLTIHAIDPKGDYTEHLLGKDPVHNEFPQAVIPAGYYFSAAVNDRTSFSLCGCTVAPGFNFADFIMPSRAELSDQFPEHFKLIEKFTI